MNEYVIGFTAVGCVVGLAIACALYMAGGRNNKGLRRYGASWVIMLTVYISALVMHKFSWWILALYPLKALEFAQGYGGNKMFPKGVQRLLIGLTSVMAGVFLCIVFGGGWWLLLPHAWLALVTTQFAFKNPVHAAAEEVFVCIMNNVTILFYVFIV